MKVLFVYSLQGAISEKHPLRLSESMHFGLSYISSFLKARGHETRLLTIGRLSKALNPKLVDDQLADFDPDLLAFTAVTTEFPFMTEVAQYVRSKTAKPHLLLGGSHVTLDPESALEGPWDSLCVGEGEYPTAELLEQLGDGRRPSGIKNLWIRTDAGWERNPTREFVADLDSFPFPDREMWAPWINDSPDARYSILLGRGCPFPCTYCANHALWRQADGDYVRYRSAENIVAEVRELNRRFPEKRDYYMEIETLSRKSWALKLCDALEEFNRGLAKPVRFGVNVRITPKTNFEDMFAALKRANFTFINVGLESGSERVRKDVLKRNESNDDIIRTVQTARKNGLQVSFYNLIGLPGETFEDHKETIRMNRICEPDWHSTSIFFPYPGTDLHRVCKEMGLIQGTVNADFIERKNASLDLPGFTKREILSAYRWFDFHAFKGKKPLPKLLYPPLKEGIRERLMASPSGRRVWAFLAGAPVLRQAAAALKS